MTDFVKVTDVSECRPTVQAAAIALENHIREKASKGPVRPSYTLIGWMNAHVGPGLEELWRAALAHDLPEIERRAISHFTHAYYVGLLAGMFGEGE